MGGRGTVLEELGEVGRPSAGVRAVFFPRSSGPRCLGAHPWRPSPDPAPHSWMPPPRAPASGPQSGYKDLLTSSCRPAVSGRFAACAPAPPPGLSPHFLLLRPRRRPLLGGSSSGRPREGAPPCSPCRRRGSPEPRRGPRMPSPGLRVNVPQTRRAGGACRRTQRRPGWRELLFGRHFIHSTFIYWAPAGRARTVILWGGGGRGPCPWGGPTRTAGVQALGGSV